MESDEYDYKKKRETIKITIVGEYGVGKTALMNKIVNNTFIEYHITTIGIDSMVLKVNKYLFKFFDMSSQERFIPLGKQYYRNCDVLFLVYSSIDRNSFEQCRKWIEIIKDYTRKTPSINNYLIC